MKFLASDLLDASAAEITRLYALRWQVELFFRDVKTYLGFDQYRVSGPQAAENFATLVVLTHQFLHWRGQGAAAPALSTLAHIQALACEVAADNVATIERAALTRHRRKRIRQRFRAHGTPCAHGSRTPKNPFRAQTKAS